MGQASLLLLKLWPLGEEGGLGWEILHMGRRVCANLSRFEGAHVCLLTCELSVSVCERMNMSSGHSSWPHPEPVVASLWSGCVFVPHLVFFTVQLTL